MSLSLYMIMFFVALAPTVLYGLWLRKRPWELKDKLAAWDPFIKIIAIAGAIIVGIASFDRFLDQRQQELLKDSIEHNEGRTAAFSQAIRATSTIATAASLAGPEESNEGTIFWRLYWGELARFEGPDVEKAMVEFGSALQVWQRTGQKPERMESLSLHVAHASRKESEAYQKDIDALKNRYKPFLQNPRNWIMDTLARLWASGFS
jgi:hypothetical protein